MCGLASFSDMDVMSGEREAPSHEPKHFFLGYGYVTGLEFADEAKTG